MSNGQGVVEIKKENVFTAQGMSGLNQSHGIIIENDEVYIADLAGKNAIKTYKTMRDNEPVIGAALFAIDMLIRQADWHVEPFSQDQKDLDRAEFLQSCLDDMSISFADVISEANTKYVFGWAFMEILYKKRNGYHEEDSTQNSKYDDGKIGWRKFELRAQESLEKWEFNEEDGGVEGMWQRPAPTYDLRFVSIKKGLLFRTTSYKNNPEGRSALRNAYRPYFYKKRIEEIEGVGIERDLAGLPMALVDPAILDPAAGEEEKNILSVITDIVQNVRRDTQEGIIFPNVFDENGHQIYSFQLLSAGGARQFDISATIDRYVKHIAMTLLADFILLGHESVGSFALSDNKTTLFALAIGAWMDQDADVLNRYAVPRLFRLNGMDTTDLPKISHGDIEEPDLGKIASFIASLVAAGMPMFPDETLQDWLRSVAGMPKTDPNAQPVLPQPTQEEALPGGPTAPSDNPEAMNRPPQRSNAGAGTTQ